MWPIFKTTVRRIGKNAPGRAGVTLVELLTVLGIFAILGTVLATMFGSMDQSYRSIHAALDIYQSARSALTRMQKEVSSTLFDASDPSVFGLLGSASELSMHTVIPADAITRDSTSSDIVGIRYALATDVPKTSVRYLANSDATTFPTLPVGDVGRADLADGITSLAFEYFASASDYDANNLETSWDSAARGGLPFLIRIRIVVEDAKQFAPPKTFETVVHLRNAA